jgi:rhodanese-related sulfurtransferase
MSLFDAARPNPAGYRDVSPAEVNLPLPGVTLVDVREVPEFTDALGHVPGAKLVPLATVPAQCLSWDKGAEYLVICKAGGRSAQASQALVRAGFTRVVNLAGGMTGWNAAGKPVER